MREIIASKRFNRFNTKSVRENNIVINHPSDEASICLECVDENCKGYCERLRSELKKLRGKKK